jgi:hypothetical protein
MHLGRAAGLADVVGTDARLTLVGTRRIALALRRRPGCVGGLPKTRVERSVRSGSRGSSTGTGSRCSDGTGNSTCQRKDGLCAVGTRIVVHAAECMGSGANTGAGRSSTRARSAANAAGESFVRVEKRARLAGPFQRGGRSEGTRRGSSAASMWFDGTGTSSAVLECEDISCTEAASRRGTQRPRIRASGGAVALRWAHRYHT